MTWPTEFLSDKKQQTGRDYLQITYLTKELYMEYIKKTLNTQKEENKTLIDKNMWRLEHMLHQKGYIKIFFKECKLFNIINEYKNAK